MLNFLARSSACVYTQSWYAGSSLSGLPSGYSLGYSIRCAYRMQCAALRGVSAIVHKGTACCGGKRSSVHSKQADTHG